MYFAKGLGHISLNGTNERWESIQAFFLLLNVRRQRNINDVYQIALESLEELLKNDRVWPRFSKKRNYHKENRTES